MKISKIIFAIFLSSFVGIMANPEILTASDSLRITGISNLGLVETIVPEAAEPEETPVESETVLPVVQAGSVATTKQAPFIEATAPVYVVPANNIQIAGKTLEIVEVNTTDGDSGLHVNKFGEKFMWGHNTTAVFRSLYNTAVGDRFTVTLNGEKSTYSIREIVIYDKVGNKLTLDGDGYYNNFIYEAKSSKSTAYDMALMTCYGPGDSQRFVVFANKI